MGDLLIRKLDEETKALLRRRAARRGLSLEADLRETLERIAREDADSPDDTEPLGTWLVHISRPGADLDDAVAAIRSAPVRGVDFE